MSMKPTKDYDSTDIQLIVEAYLFQTTPTTTSDETDAGDAQSDTPTEIALLPEEQTRGVARICRGP